VKPKIKVNISIYEEDLKDVGGDGLHHKYVVLGFKGRSYRVPVNPGKRPPRKPGEPESFLPKR